MELFGYELDSSVTNIITGAKNKATELKNKLIERQDYDKDAVAITGENPDTVGWKDKQDAARHLLAVGELSRKTNPTIASLLAKSYEFITGNEGEEDGNMDEHNNALAVSLFNAKDYNEVKVRVKQLMNESQYKDFSDKNKPVHVR